MAPHTPNKPSLHKPPSSFPWGNPFSPSLTILPKRSPQTLERPHTDKPPTSGQSSTGPGSGSTSAPDSGTPSLSDSNTSDVDSDHSSKPASTPRRRLVFATESDTERVMPGDEHPESSDLEDQIYYDLLLNSVTPEPGSPIASLVGSPTTLGISREQYDEALRAAELHEQRKSQNSSHLEVAEQIRRADREHRLKQEQEDEEFARFLQSQETAETKPAPAPKYYSQSQLDPENPLQLTRSASFGGSAMPRKMKSETPTASSSQPIKQSPSMASRPPPTIAGVKAEGSANPTHPPIPRSQPESSTTRPFGAPVSGVKRENPWESPEQTRRRVRTSYGQATSPVELIDLTGDDSDVSPAHFTPYIGVPVQHAPMPGGYPLSPELAPQQPFFEPQSNRVWQPNAGHGQYGLNNLSALDPLASDFSNPYDAFAAPHLHNAPQLHNAPYPHNAPHAYNTPNVTGVPVSSFAPTVRHGLNIADTPGPSDAPGTPDLRETQSAEEIRRLLDSIGQSDNSANLKSLSTPEALSCTLMPHQMQGLGWMTRMEENGNKGGILADDMGLGKTIQTIALIASRKSDNVHVKTTLIICPVALMLQWEQELKEKFKGGSRYQLSVAIVESKNKKRWTAEKLKEFDVVIVSYGLIAAEWKQKWDRPRTSFGNTTNSGFLFLDDDRSRWYRVICDEAQNIKNTSTNASKACCELKSVLRWCLTGTPMQNNLLELQALIQFLRIQPYTDQRIFKMQISHPLKRDTSNRQAMGRVHALLKAILLRRTKKTMVNGKLILEGLPERTVNSINSDFSEDERAYYVALETKAQSIVNRYILNASLTRNFSNMLVLLLRLRQACCHPQLVEFTLDRNFKLPDGSTASEDQMEEITKNMKPEVVKRVIDTIDEDGLNCPICMESNENPRIITHCGHSMCSECMTQMVDHVTSGGSFSGIEARCPVCRHQITRDVTDLQMFQKFHMKANYEDLFGIKDEELYFDSDDSSDSDDDEEDDMGSFIADDDSEIEYDQPSDDDDEDFPDLDEITRRNSSSNSKRQSKGKQPATKPDIKARANGKKQAPKSKKKSKGKKPAKRGPKPTAKGKQTLSDLKKAASTSKKAKKKYIAALTEDYEQSTKLGTCIDILQQIAQSGSGEKTIVFSQWTTLLDLLEVPLDRIGLKSERYDGSLSMQARNEAVQRFKNDSTLNIMLVSLKAGNAGLNLTAANHVILLDPFWNPYLEEQAIDRSHRIGQKRDVMVHRLYVKETVEDRILELQQSKRELIEGALDENAAKSISSLGIRQLVGLFGIRM